MSSYACAARYLDGLVPLAHVLGEAHYPPPLHPLRLNKVATMLARADGAPCNCDAENPLCVNSKGNALRSRSSQASPVITPPSPTFPPPPSASENLCPIPASPNSRTEGSWAPESRLQLRWDSLCDRGGACIAATLQYCIASQRSGERPSLSSLGLEALSLGCGKSREPIGCHLA